MKLIAAALAALCSIMNVAMGATPYQQTVVAPTGCVSQQNPQHNCTFVFPTATGSKGTSLTIMHVSCRVITTGYTGQTGTYADSYATLHSSGTDTEFLPLVSGPVSLAVLLKLKHTVCLSLTLRRCTLWLWAWRL